MIDRLAFLNSIEFEGVKNGSKGIGEDVSISLTKCKRRERTCDAVCFVFRNETYQLFAPSGYAKVAIYKNRVIFVDDVRGMKLTINNETKNRDRRYMKVYTSKASEWADFIGDYPLQYDELYEYYYIDRGDKR